MWFVTFSFVGILCIYCIFFLSFVVSVYLCCGCIATKIKINILRLDFPLTCKSQTSFPTSCFLLPTQWLLRVHTETHFVKVDDSNVVEAVHVSVETVVDGRRPVKIKLSGTRFSSTVITFEFHSPSYVDQTFHVIVMPSDNQSTSASVLHRLQ